MTRMQIGAPVPEPFPGGTWNRLIDLLERFEPSDTFDAAARAEIVREVLLAVERERPPYVTVVIENTSGGDLVELQPIAIAEPSYAGNYPDLSSTTVANAALLQPQPLVGGPAAVDTPLAKMAITLGPIAAGASGPAALLGLIPARVDIQNAADTVCGVQVGSATTLVSGSGSIPIHWKPAGTGEKWCLVVLGGGSGGSAIRPGFIGEDDVDADGGDGSGDVAQTGGLVTTADLYDWLGHPPIDPLPDSFDNPRKLYYDAGDRLLIIAGGYEAWQPETPYVAGDERYATGADSQQRLWTRNDNGTSGTEFDATEEAEWTEGELYTPSGWMLGGVLEKGVEGVNEGSEGEVVWLTEDLNAAEEVRWSALSQAEKDEFPQGVQDAYDANPNNTLLVPGTAEGERLRQVSKDALAFEPVYYREDGGGETVIVVNTVKQGLVGDQYVQLKSIQTDVATGVSFGLLDVAQCNNPISGS